MAEARTLVSGEASGVALVLEEALSFWGGVDPVTGDIIDVRHPQRGVNVAGRVLVMPSGRGSSSSSSVLAEAIRAGTAPVAIVMLEPDPILALGAIVARELYGRTIPVVVAPEAVVRSGETATVRAEIDSARID
jgi:predicted aconitase with swiveling domain